VTAVLVGAAGAAVMYRTSVQPGAAITKAVFERGQLVKPPTDFGQIARTVIKQRVAVRMPNAPTAYLDTYRPDGSGGQRRPVIVDPRWRIHLQFSSDGGRLREPARTRGLHDRQPGL
jgi:hypothetical protein